MDPNQGLRGRLATHVDRRALLRRVGIGGLATGFLVAGGNGIRALAEESDATRSTTATDETQIREFELTAEEFDWELSPGSVVRAWGYNQQVPGPELRVTEGDLVRVVLRNHLSVPTTIHWHGITSGQRWTASPVSTRQRSRPARSSSTSSPPRRPAAAGFTRTPTLPSRCRWVSTDR